MKTRLWEMPEPSTARATSFVLLTSDGRNIDLHFDYDRDGLVFTSGIRFMKVRAHRHRAEVYTTKWHIADAYDHLVEVSPSDWVAELLKDAPADRRGDWTLRHFMITLDSAGCFEVVGASWQALPEVQGTLVQRSGHAVQIAP